ncbi:MAG TPA: molecular chaperone TorD family protein [Acidimicrobiales bacterium]|nr:molecular chaperone TorD family protein [Acidimicrobiales bacterium]
MSVAAADLVGQADRRARLAFLLGRLLLAEPGPDAAAVVAGIPELEPLARRDGALAAEYERLLLREIPLFESVFRSEDGRRGGPVVSAAAAWYERHDFDEGGRWRVPSPDHLGLELRFLGHLAAAEAAAWADDRPDEACRAVEAERAFLAEHLGPWGQVALDALGRRASPGPFAALAMAAGELLAGECERLRPDPDHASMPAVVPERPPFPAGPSRIARWLLAPARCGAFLDLDDLAAAAGSIGAPWRPSDARSQLSRVVEAAADGRDLPALLAALRPALERAAGGHRAREREAEGLRRTWRRWRLQTECTLDWIDRLAAGPRAGALPATPVVVEVRGPGHGARVGAGVAVVGALRSLDVRTAVCDELPPDLAASLAALAEAGAEEVLLESEAVAAVARPDGGGGPGREARLLGDAGVVVRLVEGEGPLQVGVQGVGDLAAAVSAAVEDIAL